VQCCVDALISASRPGRGEVGLFSTKQSTRVWAGYFDQTPEALVEYVYVHSDSMLNVVKITIHWHMGLLDLSLGWEQQSSGPSCLEIFKL